MRVTWMMLRPVAGQSSPRCSEKRSRRLSNSDDSIPVQVRCKRVAPEKRIGQTSFICNQFPEHKTAHMLKAHTQSVRIDLYDLDHEDVPDEPVINDDKEASHE